MQNKILKKFIKYVSLNILGMVGLSCYILADTFFVSKAMGATGLAALNLSISIYSVIHGIGLMIGIGGSTRYSILKAQKEDEKANLVFTTCIKLGVLIGLIFAIIGVYGSEAIAHALGADATTLPLAKAYLMTILCFSIFFILNNIILAFVRNDKDPKLSMLAMLIGSLSNIVLDYIFMFPLKMGMFGAAFATGLAPIISIGVLTIHFVKKRNNFSFIKKSKAWHSICDISSLGLSALITEISSAVVLITYNLLILSLEGNLGVASYGLKDYELLKKVLKYAIRTSLVIASFIYIIILSNADGIIDVFNSEQKIEIARLAKTGLRIYFVGFFFAGINIIMSMYLSGIEQVKHAFIISISRGCMIIVPMVYILSIIWGMTGIWLAYVITECIVNIFIIYLVSLDQKMDNKKRLIKSYHTQ